MKVYRIGDRFRDDRGRRFILSFISSYGDKNEYYIDCALINLETGFSIKRPICIKRDKRFKLFDCDISQEELEILSHDGELKKVDECFNESL
jgi:hypothetical protein